MSRLGKIRVLMLVLALAAAGAVVLGCGKEEVHGTLKADVHGAESEDVEVGGLVYIVQVARPLNGFDHEDRAYLEGQPPAGRGQVHLGVFLKIENRTDKDEYPDAQFGIVDGEGTEFAPVSTTSPFALRPETIPPDGSLPPPGSVADRAETRGGLVLFLVDRTALPIVPIQLRVTTPEQTGLIKLDI